MSDMTVTELLKKWSCWANVVAVNQNHVCKPSVVYCCDTDGPINITVSGILLGGNRKEILALLKELDDDYSDITNYDDLLDKMITNKSVRMFFHNKVQTITIRRTGNLDKWLNLYWVEDVTTPRGDIYPVGEVYGKVYECISPQGVDRKLTEMFA
jgi:hypothetical protein